MLGRFRLFLCGVCQRLAGKSNAVDVDRLAITPERALIHHDRVEHAAGAERSLLGSADALTREHVEGRRNLARRYAVQTKQGASPAVEGIVERRSHRRLVPRERTD